MAYRNAAEVREYYTEKMGTELGPVFYRLVAEVHHLHTKWSDYVTLFGTKADRIDLLNEAAPGFVRRLQDMLFDDAILHLARLTDRSHTGKKANLTIEQLYGLVTDPDLKSKLDELNQDIKRKTAFCLDWRNRRLAHDDFALAMNCSSALPLEPASRLAVRMALEAIATLLREVSEYYMGSDILFRIKEPLGTIRLLYVLDDGLRAMAEREARIVKGREYRAQDFASRKL